MPLVSGDFDRMVENPFTQMASNPGAHARKRKRKPRFDLKVETD